jgi:multicomponent Na+:H+ antiporter subunit F
MNIVYLACAVFLLLTLALGAVRIARGPTESDRMLSAQLFGTTGVAILLVLSRALDEPRTVDVALVFALLAVIAAIAFARRMREPAPDSGEE